MKILRALVMVVPMVVLVARSANAGPPTCDNSFFPLAVGHFVTYTNPAGKLFTLTITNVTGLNVTGTGAAGSATSPTGPAATVTITCVTGGIDFDLSVVSGTPGTMKLTTTDGVTIPLPDTFVLNRPPTPPMTWTKHLKADMTGPAGAPPVNVSMAVTEVHTIVGQGPVTLPNGTTYNNAWKIQVDSTASFSGTTSAPTTIYQWIVQGTGLVQWGANGKFTWLSAHN